MSEHHDGFSTRAVHSGSRPGRAQGATTTPIYASAGFAYDTAAELEDVFAGHKPGHIYSRISNPTVAAYEERLAAIERGRGAIATGSGMAALATIIMTLTRAGDRIVSNASLFGGTHRLFTALMSRYEVEVVYIDLDEPGALQDALTDRTRFVYLETIGNPKLDVPDITATARAAHEVGAPLVVDSTLTTPFLLDAHALEADLVVHSTTKFISGHGNSIGGALVDLGRFDWNTLTDPDMRNAVSTVGRELAFLYLARQLVVQSLGNLASPFEAYLQSQGIETLALRMERHCSNALALARALEAHPAVEMVNYPGLPSSPWHQIASRQFSGGYGALFTLRLGSRERAFAFINALRIPKQLANLGDCKTLVIHPESTIYHDHPDEVRAAAGVHPDMVRVSTGIETEDDLLEDCTQALSSVDSR